MSFIDDVRTFLGSTAPTLPPEEHREVVEADGIVSVYDRRTGAFVVQISRAALDAIREGGV